MSMVFIYNVFLSKKKKKMFGPWVRKFSKRLILRIISTLINEPCRTEGPIIFLL